jgi:DNA-binding beta-propeller fold protein YncE
MALILTVIGLLTGLVVTGMRTSELQLVRASQNSLRQRTGSPQLVRLDPMPAMDGEMCEWVPASASSTLAVALQQGGGGSEAALREEIRKREPLRMIRDNYAAFSSVAVDIANNEVIMTDENLFQVLVYDRTANTPPTASMTEPKRMLGGEQTKIEFQCGLYIDPRNGDIYAVNNDTIDTLTIFNRQARGDVPPTRELYTPHGTFGIAVDEDQQEMFLTIQHDSAVVVYKKYADKEEAPIRLIQGDRTKLADPHGIAMDSKNNLIYVTNHGSVSSRDTTRPSEGSLGRGGKPNWPAGQDVAIPGSGRHEGPSITVYEQNAQGDVAPVRIIAGPKTLFNWPTGIAVDPDRDELFISNDNGDEVLVFRASANGDVAPIRVLKGPKTQIQNPTGLYLDLHNNELWVANFGNHMATVYARDASGDTPPLRVIRSAPADAPTPMIGNPHPVAYDTKRDEILVPN